jgi:N-acetylglucosamine-6-phosphate deacetylase
VKCAAVNPAKTVGVFGERGSIEAGKCADLVLLDANLDVKKIIMRGKTLYS